MKLTSNRLDYAVAYFFLVSYSKSKLNMFPWYFSNRLRYVIFHHTKMIVSLMQERTENLK